MYLDRNLETRLKRLQQSNKDWSKDVTSLHTGDEAHGRGAETPKPKPYILDSERYYPPPTP